MKLSRLAGLAVLPLVLGACGGDEGEGMEEGEVAATDSALAPAAAADTAASAMATQVTMNAVGESGTSGTAMVTASGAQTQVTVQLSGLAQGAHPGHIHSGTCEAPGPPVAPLQEITAGQDGSGTATSMVDLDAMSVMNGQHVVQYHGTAADPGARVACGAIPGHTM